MSFSRNNASYVIKEGAEHVQRWDFGPYFGPLDLVPILGPVHKKNCLGPRFFVFKNKTMQIQITLYLYNSVGAVYIQLQKI